MLGDLPSGYLLDNKGVDPIIYQLQLVYCTIVGRMEECRVDLHAKALSLGNE